MAAVVPLPSSSHARPIQISLDTSLSSCGGTNCRLHKISSRLWLALHDSSCCADFRVLAVPFGSVRFAQTGWNRLSGSCGSVRPRFGSRFLAVRSPISKNHPQDHLNRPNRILLSSRLHGRMPSASSSTRWWARPSGDRPRGGVQRSQCFKAQKCETLYSPARPVRAVTGPAGEYSVLNVLKCETLYSPAGPVRAVTGPAGEYRVINVIRPKSAKPCTPPRGPSER